MQISALRAQPALVEPPDFPSRIPGPRANLIGEGCFHLASGSIAPGDVDWVQVTIPRASSRTVIDLDFSAVTGGSALLASVVNGNTGFGTADNNAARDALCGLSGATTPAGSRNDSAVDMGATPRNAVINIAVTGAEDTGFRGIHAQNFTYDLWVYVIPVPCTSDEECDDAVDCTVDTCDRDSGLCEISPDDGACDDGEFCNGTESCDAALGCRAGSPPNCNDGVACTDDDCDEDLDACVSTPNDDSCDNEVFCDGVEWCDVQSGCRTGPPANCDDGVHCTVDYCDSGMDECVNEADDARCDDGLYCNGGETCDAVADCMAGVEPCPNQPCNESTESCAECATNDDCDDSEYCNGAELCDNGSCVAGEPPCLDGQECDEANATCGSPGLTLDLYPGQCPNRLRLNEPGFVKVALTGSPTFNVKQIKASTVVLYRSDGVGGMVRFGAESPKPGKVYADKTGARPDGECECSTAGRDGYTDLLMKFQGDRVVKKLGLRGMTSSTHIEVTVAGMLKDGTPFSVSDCVEVMPSGRPPKLAQH